MKREKYVQAAVKNARGFIVSGVDGKNKPIVDAVAYMKATVRDAYARYNTKKWKDAKWSKA